VDMYSVRRSDEPILAPSPSTSHAAPELMKMAVSVSGRSLKDEVHDTELFPATPPAQNENGRR
jgi:hypothetical protein